MEVIKILKNRTDVNWDYNNETDIFYISVGKPQSAVGMDIGEGLTVYYDEAQKEIIGFILTGLREKVLRILGKEITSEVEEERLADAERKVSLRNAETRGFGNQLFDYGGES
jgi:hypothetical protein